MLLPSDELQLSRKGISKEKLKQQLQSFETGFPWLNIIKAAEYGDGITLVDQNKSELLDVWTSYLKSEVAVTKFVPASGAASRMFKDLFEFLDAEYDKPQKAAEVKFFDDIQKFAFFQKLNEVCLKNEKQTISELIQSGKYKTVVQNLLLEKGLNYGNLPKGLLLFHKYNKLCRTPLQEHLAEGAMYAATQAGNVNIHFTVSTEHRILFEKHLAESLPVYESQFAVKYTVSFSEQKASTDTVAADADNLPFRDKGEIVFRPGGHGALIENLNDLDADVIFIKNIDNVVPDNFKNITVEYKKLLAGLLVKLQKQCFGYLKAIESGEVTPEFLKEIASFVEGDLCVKTAGLTFKSKEEETEFLRTKLNRPIRVCGMVKNTGEPGGGPFLTVNADGTVSLQILESSQIDVSNPVEKDKMMKASHFNPVDLVCGVKDYKGTKFNLAKYVDPATGFISSKSKNGKELKALELPGLWNGAMSDWNTIFVEVPIETFNPVKTVNDLLRAEHQ